MKATEKGERTYGYEERPMAVGFIISFPGGTQEQYDTVLEQLNLGGRMAPGEYFMPPGRLRKAGG